MTTKANGSVLAKAAESHPNKKKIEKDMEQAKELMRHLAQATANKNRFFEMHNNEIEAFETQIKQAKEQLIEIGERNKPLFDNDSRLMFEEGYLLISKPTKVITAKKFDLNEFAAAKPDMIEIELCVKPIKEAFLDKDQRKELKALGVEVTTEEKVEVKLKAKA